MGGWRVALLLLLAAAAGAVLVLDPWQDRAGATLKPGAHAAPRPAGTGPQLEGLGPEAVAEARRRESQQPVLAPPPAEVPGGRVLVGRVVDARRRAVPGARVRAWGPGHPEVLVLSDARGAYRVPLGVPSGAPGSGGVHASTSDGRAGTAQFWVGAEPVTGPTELPVIVLGPARDLEVRVERDGAPVAGARVVLDAEARFLAGRLADALTGADGAVRLLALPLGAYRLAAGAPGHGRGVTQVRLTSEGPARAVVPLTAPRTVTVRVLEQEGGTPIAGATVSLTERVPTGDNSVRIAPLEPLEAIAPTDADGRTTLRGLAVGDQGALAATAPGFPELLQAGWGGGPDTALKPEDVERTLTLRRLKRITWPVKDGQAPVPADGTALTLEPQTGAIPSTRPSSARMEGGRIVADGFSHGYIHAVAVAPDGSFATLFAKADESEGLETSFLPARRIDVRVLRADGSPAKGYHVWARNQGNNPLPDRAVTDAEGRATLKPRYAHLVEVFVGPRHDAFGGTLAGSVDLARSSGALELRLPPQRELRLSVTLDGRPGLPGQFSVGFGMAPLTVESEDPEQGLLVLRLPLPTAQGPQKPTLWVQASGFAPATVPLEVSEGDGPIQASVALELACVLEVAVRAPADGQSGLRLEAWSEGTQGWAYATGGGPDGSGTSEPMPGGKRVRYDALKPGRYRVVDGGTGEASDPVDLRAAGATGAAALDLSRSGFVKGTLELPEGFDARQARVALEGVKATGPFGERTGIGHVWENGTFQIRVPGTRPVVILASHPLLVPDPVIGRLEATGPREGARLRLVRGATARFAWAGPSTAAQRGPVGEGPRVLLFTGAPSAEPQATFAPVLKDGAWRFAGFDPGTYTLWIDLREGVPTLLEDVALGAGETDLGTLSLSAGSTIRLKVAVREGGTVPRLSLWAQTQGPPAYTRSVTTQGGETEVVLRGLGPGRFRVGGAPVMVAFSTPSQGPAQKIDTTVELDGTNEILLELDLR